MELAYTPAIAHPERLGILMEDGTIGAGVCQEWLYSRWMRKSGCGPCTASAIFFYLSRKSPELLPLCSFAEPDARVMTQAQAVEMVNAMWRHLTPGYMGVNTVEMFMEGAMGYARTAGVDLSPMQLHIPGCTSRLWPFSAYVDFIERGLLSDCPVAFLNLSNGSEHNLDGWHWVTIVSLHREPGDAKVLVEIVDDIQLKQINFKKWYDTTFLGGALAWFKT